MLFYLLLIFELLCVLLLLIDLSMRVSSILLSGLISEL